MQAMAYPPSGLSLAYPIMQANGKGLTMPEGPYVKIGTIIGMLALIIAYLTLADSTRWPPFSTHNRPWHPVTTLSDSPSPSAIKTPASAKRHRSARPVNSQVPVPLAPAHDGPPPAPVPTRMPPAYSCTSIICRASDRHLRADRGLWRDVPGRPRALDR